MTGIKNICVTRDIIVSLQTQLSLAKLCAMVTMKKPGETSIQSFSLPLTSLVSDSDRTEHDHEAIEKVRDSNTDRSRHAPVHVRTSGFVCALRNCHYLIGICIDLQLN